MTQRVARAAKSAALISSIVSAAVIFAACEVGPGAKGDTGPQGPAGPPGVPGVSPLVALRSPSTYLVNDWTVNGVPTVGTPPTLDVRDYFRGGKAPVTYTVAAVPDDPNDATDAAGRFMHHYNTGTYALTFTPIADVGLQYVKTDVFSVTATDADGLTSAPVIIKLKSNGAPVLVNPGPDVNVDVGTQDDYIDAATREAAKAYACASAGSSNKFNQFCITADQIQGYFDDQDEEKFTYEIAPDKPSYTARMFETTSAGGVQEHGIIVTGVSIPAKTGAVFETMILKVKAVDGNGLPSATAAEIDVVIDPRPMLRASELTAVSVDRNNEQAGASVWNDVSLLFQDYDETGADDTSSLAFHMKLKNADDAAWLMPIGTAIAADQPLAGWYRIPTNTGNLAFRAPNKAPRPIPVIVRAQEEATRGEPAQWITREFMVTVVEPAQ